MRVGYSIAIALVLSAALSASGLQPKDQGGSAKSVADVREVDLEGLKKLLVPDGAVKKPLLVNFWATWCDPCREEFPDLVKVDADYRAKGLNFIAISLDDETDIKTAVPAFLKEMKATMPTYLLNVSDPEPAILAVDKEWGGALPATFLYDAHGRIVFKHFGRVKTDELRQAIEKELRQGAAVTAAAPQGSD